MGIARTLVYKGAEAEPLYSVLPDGSVSNGEGDEKPSFFQEYKYKLEHLYSKFYTQKGTQMAKERQQEAVDFYNSLFHEVQVSYENGKDELGKIIE